LEDLAEEPLTAHGDRNTLETANLYLTIIEELASIIPDTGVQSIAPILVEKMDLLLHKLIVMQPNLNDFTEDRDSIASANNPTARFRESAERALAFWFSALLRMVVIHRPAFTVPVSAPKLGNISEKIRLLISILCISLSQLLRHLLCFLPTSDYIPRSPLLGDCHPIQRVLMQTHALDVAASLIDAFPNEARHQCARFLKEKCTPCISFQKDSRLAYLLGPIPDSPSSISLQPASLPSPAASSFTPAPTPSGNFLVGTQQSTASAGIPTAMAEGANPIASRLRLQYRGHVIGPYPIRPWELVEDAAPIVGVNDTAVSLGYFDARRVRA